MPKRRMALLLLFVSVDVLGYSLFFPLLPYYAGLFGAGPTLVGLMIASNAAAQIIASPIVGSLSDRFGRRPLLIASLIGTIISFVVLGLAEPIGRQIATLWPLDWAGNPAASAAGWTVVVLFACRILDGLTGGNVAVARAYVADVTDDASRAKGLGLIGAAFGLGYVVGPAIGGTLSNCEAAARLLSSVGLSRFAVPAFVAVLIAVLNLAGVLRWLPESLPRGGVAPRDRLQPVAALLESLRAALAHPRLGPLLLTRFIFSLALTLFMANFALYTQYHLGLTDRGTSYFMTYAGMLLILVQVAIIGWITRRLNEWQILVRGLVGITLAFVGLALVSSAPGLALVLLPLALIGGVLNAIVNSLISKSVRAEEAGSALGLGTAAESLTWVIAPSLGGVLIANVGGRSLGMAAAVLTGLLVVSAARRGATTEQRQLAPTDGPQSEPGPPPIP